jgi:hypothetical protein
VTILHHATQMVHMLADQSVFSSVAAMVGKSGV